MNDDAAQRFRLRFVRVLEYIDAHLDESLDVEVLSGVAAFSKYHFHRQFSGLFEVGVYQYIQLSRLKRAACQLAFRSTLSVLDIAIASGYEGPEAFARAFRNRVGQSPSEFRKQPRWEAWNDTWQPLTDLRNQHMNPQHTSEDVRIVDFPETKIAALMHRGDPALLGDSIRRFIEWRKQNHLPPRISATFNIVHDDPDRVDPAEFRMELAAATDQEVMNNPCGVVGKVIPAGRCAVLRHTGSDETLHQSVTFLYATWLPGSGEEPGEFPLLFQRVRFFPDVPEHEAVTDIFLPLR